jgi:anti-anti-sigma factor
VDHGLSIEQRTTATGTAWALAGQLDLHAVDTAIAVFQSAAAGTRDDLHLDIGQLDFIGFAALDMLVDLSRQLASRGRRLVVTPPTPLLRRVAELAEVELLPTGHETVEIPPRRSDRVPVGRAIVSSG